MDPLTRGVARYSDALLEAQKNGEDWAKVSESAFKKLEDVIVDFATTGKASFSDLFSSIQADIARTVVQQQISGPLSSALSSGIGNIFGSMFGPSTAPGTFFSGAELAGARAAGGPTSRGMPYLVGERGP
jgi:lambda family phage tail tape measure protein